MITSGIFQHIAGSEVFSLSTIFDCPVLEFPKVTMDRGSITAVNGDVEIPFEIKRIFYLYDIPAGAERGGHAHKELYQLLVALSGSFDVVLQDGRNKKTVSLNRPNFGLLVPPGVWNELGSFSAGAIAMAFASDIYKESDYIRNLEEFKELKGRK